MSLPGALPQLYLRPIPGPLPRVVVGALDRFVTGGVTESARGSSAHLQAVLYPPTRLPAWSGDSSVFVGGHLDHLKFGERCRIDRLLGSILQFHSQLFGVEPVVRVVVTSCVEGGADVGVVLAADDPRFLGVGGGEPEYLMLGARLARAWWGVGCRIIGPFAKELEAGIRAVAAMFWGDEIGSSARDSRLGEWRALAKTRTPRRWYRTPMFDEGEHARIALALYNAALEGAPLVERLRAITVATWGTAVMEREVRRSLREIGAKV